MANPPEPFVLTELLDREITRAAELLVAARHPVGLTGAGLSVESGIPPFRGPGGLWTKHGEPPMDGYQRFVRDPVRAWRERLRPTEGWAVALFDTLSRAKPNAGHRALAELERIGHLPFLITQNVDDLHRQAGTLGLAEIHGNYRLLRCVDCVARFDPEEIPVDPERLPPHCPRCGGLVKGDTVQFGEPIPPDVLARCTDEVERSDCMLVVGTSATVFPAAGFPLDVVRRRGTLIEVNPEPTELTPVSSVALHGPGGAVLERLLDHVGRVRRAS